MRNHLKLISSSAISYLITIVTTPILTRLYDPYSFGVIATLMSLIQIIDRFSSLNIEMSIQNSNSNEESSATVKLCIILLGVTTITILLGQFLPVKTLILSTGISKHSFFIFIALLTFFSGANRIFVNYCISNKLFSTIAKAKIISSCLEFLTKLTFYSFGNFGLVFGNISRFLGIILLSYNHLIKSLKKSNKGKKNHFKKGLKELKDKIGYAKYTTPAGIINALGGNIPLLIIASNYSQIELGLFSLTLFVMQAPSGFIQTSISQIYLSELEEARKKRRLMLHLMKSLKTLLAVSISTILFLYVIKSLLPILLGNEWNQVPNLIPLLIPYVFAGSIVSPITKTIELTFNNKLGFIAHIIQTTLRIVPITISAIILDLEFEASILILSISTFVGYLFTTYFIWIAVIGSDRKKLIL